MQSPMPYEPVEELSLESASTLSVPRMIFGIIIASLAVSTMVLAGLILFLRTPSEVLVPVSPSPKTRVEEILPVTSSPLPALNTPNSKVLTGGTHTFQTFNNCGPAALSMALSYYGISESQQKLGEALRPYQVAHGDNDDKSVTLQEVAAKAKEFGFITYQRPGGTVEIMEAFIAQDMPIIARTWLKPGEDIGHFRVVRGYDKGNKTLVQDDSLQGKDKIYTYDEFNDVWSAFNYEFLVLVPKEKQAVAERILGPLADEKNAWTTALQLAKAQLQTNPSDVYAQFNESVALYHLGRYEEAKFAYEKVAERLPSRMLWYQLEPVLAYSKLGDDDRVLQVSDRILENHNRAYSELHFLKHEIYTKRGEQRAADEALQAVQRYNQSSYWKVNLL